MIPAQHPSIHLISVYPYTGSTAGQACCDLHSSHTQPFSNPILSLPSWLLINTVHPASANSRKQASAQIIPYKPGSHPSRGKKAINDLQFHGAFNRRQLQSPCRFGGPVTPLTSTCLVSVLWMRKLGPVQWNNLPTRQGKG